MSAEFHGLMPDWQAAALKPGDLTGVFLQGVTKATGVDAWMCVPSSSFYWPSGFASGAAIVDIGLGLFALAVIGVRIISLVGWRSNMLSKAALRRLTGRDGYFPTSGDGI